MSVRWPGSPYIRVGRETARFEKKCLPPAPPPQQPKKDPGLHCHTRAVALSDAIDFFLLHSACFTSSLTNLTHSQKHYATVACAFSDPSSHDCPRRSSLAPTGLSSNRPTLRPLGNSQTLLCIARLELTSLPTIAARHGRCRAQFAAAVRGLPLRRQCRRRPCRDGEFLSQLVARRPSQR
jgi:hypothetical protein